MASRWLSPWASAVLLAALLAPATRPGVAPRGDWQGRESAPPLIPVGVVVAQILVDLVLSMDYSPPKPSRGDLDHLAGLKRRWEVLPGQIPGRGPHAKPRLTQGGRLAAARSDPTVGPRDTLGQLVAIKRWRA